MIAIISGTNRPGSKTLQVVGTLARLLEDHGTPTTVIDLRDLPVAVLAPSSYANKPPELGPMQDAVLKADGLLTVTPEYNGSFPGVLKLFIDMLRFPESLVEKPAAFVGLAAGRWGALRAVEQLEMIFQYRSAHLFGRRVFIPDVGSLFDDSGELVDEEIRSRLHSFASAFADFVAALRR